MLGTVVFLDIFQGQVSLFKGDLGGSPWGFKKTMGFELDRV